MSPRHFSRYMKNPYFQTDHYKNESAEMQIQRKIENFLKKINIFKNIKRGKNVK